MTNHSADSAIRTDNARIVQSYGSIASSSSQVVPIPQTIMTPTFEENPLESSTFEKKEVQEASAFEKKVEVEP